MSSKSLWEILNSSLALLSPLLHLKFFTLMNVLNHTYCISIQSRNFLVKPEFSLLSTPNRTQILLVMHCVYYLFPVSVFYGFNSGLNSGPYHSFSGQYNIKYMFKWSHCSTYILTFFSNIFINHILKLEN